MMLDFKTKSHNQDRLALGMRRGLSGVGAFANRPLPRSTGINTVERRTYPHAKQYLKCQKEVHGNKQTRKAVAMRF